MMVNKIRKVTLLFRCRRSAGTGRGSVKVYTTQRIRGCRHPRQIHLGYIRDADTISAGDRDNIEEKLKERWGKAFGNSHVEIDWKSTERKWATRAAHKDRKVDREAALEQIGGWLDKNDEDITDSFKEGLPEGREPVPMARAKFVTLYFEIPRRLARKLLADEDEVESWWTTHEAPRLLYRFHQYVCRQADLKQKTRPDVTFSRGAFTDYLLWNIKRGYAASEYLRSHREPQTVQFIDEKVRDVVSWPPSSWVSSYSGFDKLIPDLTTATVERVTTRRDGVFLEIRDGERTFSSSIHVRDADERTRVVDALRRAYGRTLEDAGGQVAE